MNNNKTLRQLLAAALLSCLPLFCQAQIVTLTGNDVKALLNQPTSLYSFFSEKDGQLAPVPHQWVQWSKQGYPYFEKDKETELAGKPGIIDAEDRLMLRFEDGGTQTLSTRPTEDVVAQLKITQGDQTRYFYVVKNAYLQSTERYVQFDPEHMVIKSTDFALFMADHNLLMWNDFFYRGYKSPSGKRESILDSLKLRLSAGLFGENNRITLDNSNLDPHVEQIIRGPLATLVYATTSVKVARVTVLKIHNYFEVMPRQVDIHNRFTLPGIADTVLDRPALDLSLDGNNLQGGKLVTSWTGNKVAVTDGKLSATEKAMMAMPLEGDNWLWFGTGRGFDLLAQLVFLKGFDTPVRLLYQDDNTLSNPPERFPGQQPNVGFSLTDIPFGKEFYFVARLFYSKDSNGEPPGVYARHLLAEPRATLTVL
ncbi:hypothetical protein A11A3_15492 [Alcanivorax hongdengensis A-11-3]|uniref:Uncharacterized protein n=1 Tax=Alcanivorax hongdengensis A-11-3 TaxID=1177179 RepID=L0WAG2_9GAMM|nr:hypothetical protein [Alcanivorax hongdengensis]EKF73077.1 hypothetical protein A11A3_15492 [Alcanivorax hongdengensis A-11-3]